jgi:hypothetical protein
MLILCFSIFQWLRLCYQFGLCSSFVLVFYHYYQLLICVWWVCCKTTSSCCWFRYMHWNQGRQNGHPRIKSTGWTSIKSECLSPASGRMSPFALSHECNSSRNEQLNDYGNDWILSHLGHKWLLQCFWPWVIVDKSFIPSQSFMGWGSFVILSLMWNIIDDYFLQGHWCVIGGDEAGWVNCRRGMSRWRGKVSHTLMWHVSLMGRA